MEVDLKKQDGTFYGDEIKTRLGGGEGRVYPSLFAACGKSLGIERT